ncbi:MAG: hypothetical protein WA775_15690 [Psychroserpens sp.]|uniref:hypothetical protein n=1 Tax=Psychroserpens sp. TaxID=2020870 RepID=UPI003C730D8A
MKTDVKPPTSFWVVATLALLWSIIEIYFSSFEINYLEQNLTVQEFDKFQSLPLWYIAVFMIALFSEALGTLMLFFRQRIATKFFGLALVALIIIELYWLFVFDITETSVLFFLIIPLIVIAITVFLYMYSKKATAKGWLK